MKAYYIWTIGCQMNKADSTYLAEALERAGYSPAEKIDRADVVVLNTCSVRQSAEDRVYGKLSSLIALKRKRPDMVVALMGCMVGSDTVGLKKRFPVVDHFVPPSGVPELLEVLPSGRDAGEEDFGVDLSAVGPDGVVAYVPVMYGCDNYCTYCIVPYRRGHERSRDVPDIIEEIGRLGARGVKEVVLLGQKIDAYGHDLQLKPDLADLLTAANSVAGIERLRFLTSHPQDMTHKLVRAVAQLPKVCEYVNLPIQSGDDEILAAMGRGYTVDDYRRVVQEIRALMPEVGLTTDVIVGFPGERVDQFENTLHLVEEMAFDAVHVAVFSPRPGTKAAEMPDDVPIEEKARRREAVEATQRSVLEAANARLVGREVEVLIESREKGAWQGRTRGNKLVFSDAQEELSGALVQVEVTESTPWWLRGKLRSIRSR